MLIILIAIIEGEGCMSWYLSPKVEHRFYSQLLYNFQNVKHSAFWSIIFFAFNSKLRFMAFFLIRCTKFSLEQLFFNNS